MFGRGMGRTLVRPNNWLETDDDQALNLGMEQETRPKWPGPDQT
jgi:hypothetical protein